MYVSLSKLTLCEDTVRYFLQSDINVYVWLLCVLMTLCGKYFVNPRRDHQLRGVILLPSQVGEEEDDFLF